MKTSKTLENRNETRRKLLLDQLARQAPFIEGSLSPVKRKGCKKLGWQLTWKQAGKTQTVYVPVDLVPEVKQWVKEYKQLKKLIRKVTAQSLAIIRNHTARKRAAARGKALIR